VNNWHRYVTLQKKSDARKGNKNSKPDAERHAPCAAENSLKDGDSACLFSLYSLSRSIGEISSAPIILRSNNGGHCACCINWMGNDISRADENGERTGNRVSTLQTTRTWRMVMGSAN